VRCKVEQVYKQGSKEVVLLPTTACINSVRSATEYDFYTLLVAVLY